MSQEHSPHKHPFLEPYKKTKVSNHNIYAKDLAQTLKGSMIAVSVCACTYDIWLFDSVGCVLLAAVVLPPLICRGS